MVSGNYKAGEKRYDHSQGIQNSPRSRKNLQLLYQTVYHLSTVQMNPLTILSVVEHRRMETHLHLLFHQTVYSPHESIYTVHQTGESFCLSFRRRKLI